MKQASEECFSRWGEKRRFCIKYGINHGNFNRALSDSKHHGLDPAWIACLVMEYEISADWILTGRGDMYSSRMEKRDTYVTPSNNN